MKHEPIYQLCDCSITVGRYWINDGGSSMNAIHAYKLANKLRAWKKPLVTNPFPRHSEAYRVFNKLIEDSKK